MLVSNGRGRLLALGVAVMLVTAVFAPVAFSQGDETAAATTASNDITIWDNIIAAGWVGGLIILLSIAGLSLVLIFAMQIRRDVMVPPELVGHVESLFEEEDFDAALEVVEGNPSFFSTVLAAGLPRIDRPYKEIEEAMEEAGDQEASKLQQKIGYLSLIASISPMMGLLGTVLGMVGAFNVIATSKTSPKPAELAGGISQALMTTCMGLIVAIPMTVAYFVFRNRVTNVILEVGNLATELMERFDEQPEG